MAIYGISKYGAPSVYGAAAGELAGDYSAPFFTATSVDYGSIKLSWGVPNGTWSRFVVIRNSYGYPVDTDDGYLVFENADGSAMPYPDTGIATGREYYYAIFVQTSDATWHLSARTTGLSVKDFGTLDQMWSCVPTAIRTANRNIADDAAENQDLKDFLRIVAFEYDREKTQAELLRNLADPSYVPASLLPLLARQYGLVYEPSIGDKSMRSLVTYAIRLYQAKGSTGGLQDFIKAFSGYDTELLSGKNLLLDYNQSSFEEGTSSWSATNATLDVVGTGVVLPYIETVDFSNRQQGSMEVTAVAGGNVSLVSASADYTLYGVPVTAGSAYTFSVYARAAATVRAVTTSISWYTRAGVFISTSTGTSTNDAVGSWTRVSNTATAPTGAVFAVVGVTIASAGAGEVHYVDAAQLEAGSSATTFEDARLVKIKLVPTAINELTNPNFTVDTTGWTVTNYSNIELVDALGTNPHAVLSGNAVEIYPDTLSEVSLTSDLITGINSNEYYSFSIYYNVGDYNSTPTTTDGAYVSIEWYDSVDALISSIDGNVVHHYRKPAATWADENPILADGDVGVESDRLEFKIGDGVTAWNSLSYASYALNYDRRLSGEWSSSEVPGLGVIAVSTDLGKFKLGDGVTTWGMLSYATTLPVWGRPSVSAKSPDGTAKCKVSLKWEPSNLDMAVVIDEALLERSPFVSAFFDGTVGREDITGLMWESTANASRSYYYANHLAVVRRLEAVLPDWMQLGSSFALTYGV